MRWLLALLLSVSLASAAQTYVIAVGVDQYDDATISPLHFASADARALAAAFIAGGVPEKNVAVLTSDQTERLKLATTGNLIGALDAARERAVEGDTLIFLFSGHGMQQGSDAYLLTMDVRRSLLDTTALAMSKVNEALRGFQGSNVVFLIDACRNDPHAGRAEAAASLDERFAKAMRPRILPGANLPAPKVASLLACGIGERAWEMPAEGHGAFTWWLLQGLQGAARDDDGAVRLNRLAAYVTTEVPKWAARARQKQDPRFDAEGVGDFVLLRTPGLPATAPAAPKEPAPAVVSGEFRLPDYLSKWQAQMPKNLQYRIRAKDGMPQVLIPAGEFLMGSPEGQGNQDEHPQKRIYLNSFWMDQHCVTVAQYRRFCQATSKVFPTNLTFSQADYPMTEVSWDDAAAYAKWAGSALPTEAQWEKAARGGLEGKQFPWGDEEPKGRACFNVRSPAPVGSFAPNGYGLFDMAGNVWQWCQAWYDERWYARMPGRDPVATTPSIARVGRGGRWLDLGPAYLRAAYRYGLVPALRGNCLGFRLAEAL